MHKTSMNAEAVETIVIFGEYTLSPLNLLSYQGSLTEMDPLTREKQLGAGLTKFK